MDFSFSIKGTGRFRANIYRQRGSFSAVLRCVPFELPDSDKLGIPETVMNLSDTKSGIVLVTGAAGNGKSTTLSCMIDKINSNSEGHIITIEDPIEFLHRNQGSIVSQREIAIDTDNYPAALRACLRQAPDVILLGEMRDYETISAAITAAETGHLVLSTLHTTSAPQTIERIIDAYPHHGQSQARTQLANVLKGIVTQQLIPRDDGEGMAIATEILINTEAIANQIRENKTHQIISSMQGSYSLGMHTMNSDLRRLVKEQKITNTTALKYCSNVKDFENLR